MVCVLVQPRPPFPRPTRRPVVKRPGVSKNLEGGCSRACSCCSLCFARLASLAQVAGRTNQPLVCPPVPIPLSLKRKKKSALTNINLGCIHLLALNRVFGIRIYININCKKKKKETF